MIGCEIADVCTTLLTGPCTNDPYMRAAREVRSVAFIEITTSDGQIGIGETYAGYFCPEVVPSIVDFFRPILLGQSVDDIGELWERMYHCGNYWCRVGLGLAVINGIEAALWDLRGKSEGKPVYELVGGTRHKSLPCYATSGPTSYPKYELAERLEHYLHIGFNAVKLGAGCHSIGKGFFCPMDPTEAADFESEKLQFVRTTFGDQLQVILDGHMSNSPTGAWRLETALSVMRAVEPYNLVFFEEPLHYDDMRGYAELCSATKIPIAGGEVLTGIAEWQHYVDRHCFDIGQVDAAFTGGIKHVLEVAKLLENHGRTIATHCWGAGGALMQNIHCGFAADNTCILEIPPDFGPLHSEIVGDSFRMENGRVLPPQTPGLGICLSDEIKERFPFLPGSGEFNSVPGKVMQEERVNL